MLAAGAATRMGASKVSLPWGESTVLGTVLNRMRSTSVDRVVVVVGHHAGEVEPIARDAGFEAVRNPDPDRGSFSSMLTGWTHIAATVDAAVVVLGDMPDVDPTVIDSMIGMYLDTGAAAVRCEYTDGAGHPLLVSGSVILAADPNVAQPLWEAVSALHSDSRHTISVPAPKPRDLNTPTDLNGR